MKAIFILVVIFSSSLSAKASEIDTSLLQAMKTCWVGSSANRGPLNRLFHSLYDPVTNLSVGTKMEWVMDLAKVNIILSDGVLAGKHLYFEQLGSDVRIQYHDLKDGTMLKFFSQGPLPSVTQDGTVNTVSGSVDLVNPTTNEKIQVDAEKLSACLEKSLN